MSRNLNSIVDNNTKNLNPKFSTFPYLKVCESNHVLNYFNKKQTIDLHFNIYVILTLCFPIKRNLVT